MTSLLIYAFTFAITALSVSKYMEFENKHVLSYAGKRIKYGNIWNLVTSILIFFPFIFIYTFRAQSVGTDSSGYSQYFEFLKKLSITEINTTFVEPGYVLLNVLGKAIFDKVNSVYFLCCVVIVFCLKSIFVQRKSLDVKILLYIYFMTGYAFSCNITRQFIAMMIVMVGLKYIEERKFFKYLLFVLLAVCFHKSAILTLLFYYIYDCKFTRNKKIYRFIVLVISVCIPFFGTFISRLLISTNFYVMYLDLTGMINWGEFAFLIYVIPEFILLFYMEKFMTGEGTQKASKLLNLFCLYLPFQFAQFFTELIVRVGYYAAILRIILIPMMLLNIENSRKRKQCTWLVLLWYGIYYIVMYAILNGGETYPYKFMWSE